MANQKLKKINERHKKRLDVFMKSDEVVDILIADLELALCPDIPHNTFFEATKQQMGILLSACRDDVDEKASSFCTIGRDFSFANILGRRLREIYGHDKLGVLYDEWENEREFVTHSFQKYPANLFNSYAKRFGFKNMLREWMRRNPEQAQNMIAEYDFLNRL